MKEGHIPKDPAHALFESDLPFTDFAGSGTPLAPSWLQEAIPFDQRGSNQESKDRSPMISTT
jgi:hypothetical protein